MTVLKRPPKHRLQTIGIRDYELAAQILSKGFSSQPENTWKAGFDRLKVAYGIDYDRIAYVLLNEEEPAGIILTLRQEPDARHPDIQVVGLSSWFVHDSSRHLSMWMLKQVLAEPETTYKDLTPTQAVARLSVLLGFQPSSRGTGRFNLARMALRRTGRAKVSVIDQESFRSTSKTKELISQHLQWGCLLLSIRVGARDHSVVLKPLVNTNRLVLIYSDDIRIFFSNIGAVARRLLKRGFLTLDFDLPGSIEPNAPYQLVSNISRLSKGDWIQPDHVVDHLNSELTIFDFV